MSDTPKSSVDEIRARFDADVERFSNLETGQSSTIDAALMLDLVARAARAATPHARDLLDIGCGAGNYSLKLLQQLPGMSVTLADLSRPMLDRAAARVGAATSGRVQTMQGDIREVAIEPGSMDVITAAAVFHHLRTDDEWRLVFEKCYRALRPGGSIWIVDFVSHDAAAIQALMWQGYGDYLEQLRDATYREHVFAYVEREDTPRSVLYQCEQLRAAGFSDVEILHKHGCIAAFGAIRT